MKNKYKPTYIIFLTLLSYTLCNSCGIGDCGTYCLSYGDLAFIPYTVEDTVWASNLNDNSVYTVVWDNTDTLHEYINALEIYACDNYFEKRTVLIENTDPTLEGLDEFYISTNCEEGNFNVYFNFQFMTADSYHKNISFSYEPFYIDNKFVKKSATAVINNVEYKNVFWLVNGVNDTLIYSSTSGFIQLKSRLGNLNFTN